MEVITEKREKPPFSYRESFSVALMGKGRVAVAANITLFSYWGGDAPLGDHAVGWSLDWSLYENRLIKLARDDVDPMTRICMEDVVQRAISGYLAEWEKPFGNPFACDGSSEEMFEDWAGLKKLAYNGNFSGAGRPALRKRRETLATLSHKLKRQLRRMFSDLPRGNWKIIPLEPSTCTPAPS